MPATITALPEITRPITRHAAPSQSDAIMRFGRCGSVPDTDRKNPSGMGEQSDHQAEGDQDAALPPYVDIEGGATDYPRARAGLDRLGQIYEPVIAAMRRLAHQDLAAKMLAGQADAPDERQDSGDR